MSLYPVSNTWDTKYVTVSNTWTRKDGQSIHCAMVYDIKLCQYNSNKYIQQYFFCLFCEV